MFREAAKKKRFFLGYLSQMWVGGVADSQTRSKPLKTPPNCPENRLFRPKFHLSFSQISQKPWGGWVGKQIWEKYPKKNVFFLAASLTEYNRNNKNYEVQANHFVGFNFMIKLFFNLIHQFIQM